MWKSSIRPAIAGKRCGRVRRQHDAVLASQPRCLVERAVELDVRIEIDDIASRPRQEVTQEARLDRRRELGDIVDGGELTDLGWKSRPMSLSRRQRKDSRRSANCLASSSIRRRVKLPSEDGARRTNPPDTRAWAR